jgi:exosortase D (VPLPA-CTERM-specific)
MPSRPSWLGLLPVLIGCFFLLLGEMGGEFFSLYVSIWFMIFGLCWAQFGWRKLNIILFPLMLFLTTFPPPRFFYVRLVSSVQLISASMATQVLELIQIRVFRQGDVLDLGFSSFQVTGAYSGLRFLIPICIIALIFVYLFRASFWRRSLVFGLAVFLAVSLNGLRIAVLVLLANTKQTEPVARWVNEASGWTMFFVAIATLLAAIFLLSDRHKNEKGQQKTLRHMKPGAGDPDSNPVTSKERLPLPYVTALLVVVGLFFFLQYRGHTYDHFPQARSLETFPDRIGLWQGQRFFFSSDIIEILDLNDYVQMEYRDPDGKEIDFYVSWYTSQSKGKSIHTPETCLRVGNWRFQESNSISVNFPGHEDSPIRIKRTVLTNEKRRWIMYFWFRCRGRSLINAYELKFFNFWDRFIRRRTDGALIRVMTRVSESETSDDAEQRLQRFLNSALPILDTYLPP